MSQMVKVLVVGSGITGAATAALLKQHLPSTYQITVWDKARGAGGRMSTSRNSTEKSSVDLGAQYITLTSQYKSKRQQLYSDLLAKGLLAPMVGKIEGPNKFDQADAEHYVTPLGISSLVKHYLHQAQVNVEYNRHVVSVKSQGPNSLIVTDLHGEGTDFQAVVLTMPVPQILQLEGTVQKALDEHRNIWDQLMGITYSSRFALGLFYQTGTQLPYSWCAKYLEDNPCIRYVAIDTKKRGLEDKNSGPSLTVHTTVRFGLQHINKDKEQVKDIIFTNLKQCLPDLPEPVEVKSHKWRYSQIHRCYPGSPGCITLYEQPLIVLGGDAFTQSTFDSCLDSAEAIADTVSNYFKNKNP